MKRHVFTAEDALKRKAVSVLDPIERAKTEPKSLRRAINAKCYECQGEDADPSWQWRVGNCEIPDCPLWPHRPYQKQKGLPTPARLRLIGE